MLGVGLGLMVGRRLAGGFSLGDLTGIAVWYKPADESSLTVDARNFVTGMEDLTGNGYNATVPGHTSSFPKNPSSNFQIGGKNAVGFDGQRDGDKFATGYTPPSAFWMAAYVTRGSQVQDGSTTIRSFFSAAPNASTAVDLGTGRTDNDDFAKISFFSNSVVYSGANGSYRVGDRASIIMEYSVGNYCRVWQDGTLIIDTSVNVATTPGPLYVGGSNQNVDRKFNGLISEIAVGSGTLTDAERAAIDSYFASTYGGCVAETSLIYNQTAATVVATDVHAEQGAVKAGNFFITTTEEGSSPAPAENSRSISVYNSSWVFQSQYDTSGDISGTPHSQCNGLYFDTSTDKLYVGVNNFPTTPKDSWILVYDVNPTTGALTFDAVHDVAAAWSEGCAKYGSEFFVIYHDLWEVHRYNSSWVLQEVHTLPGASLYYDSGDGGFIAQSAMFIGDILYFPIHNGNSRANRYEAFYWTGSAFITTTPGQYSPFTLAGQGISWDGTYNWWALRDDASNTHDVGRSTPLTRTVKIG